MDHSVIQYHLRKNMCCSEKYDYIKMRAVYIKFMSETDLFIGIPILNPKTFKNLINAWSNSPDGWLIKEGRGVDARFYKRDGYIWRCRMPQNKLIAKVAGSISRMNLRSIKWQW